MQPRLFESAGHLGRGLAGTDDDGAAGRFRRQMRGDGMGRLGRRNGVGEQAFEEIAIHQVRLVQGSAHHRGEGADRKRDGAGGTSLPGRQKTVIEPV